MSAWATVVGAVVGGAAATISGAVIPLIMERGRIKRSDKTQRREDRHRVGELLISLVAIRRSIAGDFVKYNPSAPIPPAIGNEESKREASEIGHRLELAVQFHAPDCADLVEVAEKAVNQLAQKSFEHGAAMYMDRDHPIESLAARQVNWVTTQQKLGEAVDEAVKKVLAELAKDAD